MLTVAKKIYLEEHLSTPLQRPADDEIGPRRFPLEDLWLEGDPELLLSNPGQWFSKLRESVGPRSNEYGLRIRFILEAGRTQREEPLDFLNLLKSFLDRMSWRFEGLFLRGEMETGVKPGIHLVWDSRPPTLPTQLWLRSRERVDGTLPQAVPPLHLHILLHDLCQGYLEMWNDGTMSWLLSVLSRKTQDSFRPGQLGGLTMARSNRHEQGVSLGLVGTRIEEGGKMSLQLGDMSRAV